MPRRPVIHALAAKALYPVLIAGLRASQLAYLPGAGHNAYQDRLRVYLEIVRAFLTGRPPPVAPRATDFLPSDYEGPS
jgi:hypothetical protein